MANPIFMVYRVDAEITCRKSHSRKTWRDFINREYTWQYLKEENQNPECVRAEPIISCLNLNCWNAKTVVLTSVRTGSALNAVFTKTVWLFPARWKNLKNPANKQLALAQRTYYCQHFVTFCWSFPGPAMPNPDSFPKTASRKALSQQTHKINGWIRHPRRVSGLNSESREIGRDS